MGVPAAAVRELDQAPGKAVAKSLFNADAGRLGSRQYPLPRGRPDAETGGEQSVRAVCNGCACGAHLRPQHLPDVAGAWRCLVLGVWGPLHKALIIYMYAIHVHVYSIFMFSIQFTTVHRCYATDG